MTLFGDQLVAQVRSRVASPVTGACRVPALQISGVRVAPGHIYVIKTGILNAQSSFDSDIAAVSIRYAIGRVAGDRIADAQSSVLARSLLPCEHNYSDEPWGPLFAFYTTSGGGMLSVALCVERYRGMGNVWLNASRHRPISMSILDASRTKEA